MLRRSSLVLAGFRMQHKRGTGLWDEDHVNHYNTNRYLTARATMQWYYSMERLQTRVSVSARQVAQSDHNNNGLHHSGRGAFDRELERRGVEVDKYPLTTTTGAKRVAELVLLRRAKLEERSAKILDEQRSKLHRESPSEWYDERCGPLNPNFLRSMQPLYDTAITNLPETPVVQVTST